MVSINPNPPAQGFYIDHSKMVSPGFDSLTPPANNNTTATATATALNAAENSNSSEFWSEEDPNKKIRKPYTITKSRESWTDREHEKFLEALQLFDRDWKKIEAFVGSKTVIQIRSHAQKYFLKVQKSGKTEHVPPPRPKRKAAHPYPQKASKNAPVVSQITRPVQSSGSLLELGHVLRHDSLSLPGNSISDPTLSYWTSYTEPSGNVSHVTKEEVVTRPTVMKTCCSSSSNESTLTMWPSGETKGKLTEPVRVMPDFAKVYKFIGSVFDPNASGHLQKLKNMDPINLETVLLLMKNLSVNLMSPEFEDHRKLLSSYLVDTEQTKSSSICSSLRICQPDISIPSV